jgi:hypothetical protein
MHFSGKRDEITKKFIESTYVNRKLEKRRGGGVIPCYEHLWKNA